MHKKVVIYTKANCPYCGWTKELLDSEHISYAEIRVDLDPEVREEMEQLSHRKTVPQIFIGDRHVGGFDDLKALYDSGEFHSWLK